MATVARGPYSKLRSFYLLPGSTLSDFTKNICISDFCEAYLINGDKGTEDASIFAFQSTEVVPGFNLTIPFDNGCGDAIVSKDACEKLNPIMGGGR